MMSEDALKILFFSAEVAPFAKTGGLADVAGALPKALKQLGHDIRIVMPRYGFIGREQFDLNEVLQGVPVPINGRVETAAIWEGRIGAAVQVYLVENGKYYDREGIYMYNDDADRFIFFCRAALEMLKRLNWVPDVLHCNDWHTAIVPNWLQTIYQDDPFYQRMVTVYSIHNLAYQGIFGHRVLEIAGIDRYQYCAPPEYVDQNQINMMGRGIFYADIISTVSETYAKEILTPEYGHGYDRLLRERRDRLYGILNGIDYEVNNPATDPHIYQHYDRQDFTAKLQNKLALQRETGLAETADTPLIGMVSRLADQKGFDLIGPIFDQMIHNLDFQLILLGTGSDYYHDLFNDLKQRYPERVAVYLTFNTPLAQKIYAGSDMFLMPSRFEPCGLGQLAAFRYGSAPIVRETGGLKDTVSNFDPSVDAGNGFTFKLYDSLAMYTAIVRAVETYKYREQWRNIIRRGMTADFSWERAAREYVELYRRAQSVHAPPQTPQEFLDVPGENR
jgi:starch synthase